jgi:hypothetical protein
MMTIAMKVVEEARYAPAVVTMHRALSFRPTASKSEDA